MDGTQDGDLPVARRGQEAPAQGQLGAHARRRGAALHLDGLGGLGDQNGGGLLQAQLAHRELHGSPGGRAVHQAARRGFTHSGHADRIIDLRGGTPDALFRPCPAHSGCRLRVGRSGAHKLPHMLLVGGQKAMCSSLRLLEKALKTSLAAGRIAGVVGVATCLSGVATWIKITRTSGHEASATAARAGSLLTAGYNRGGTLGLQLLGQGGRLGGGQHLGGTTGNGGGLAHNRAGLQTLATRGTRYDLLGLLGLLLLLELLDLLDLLFFLQTTGTAAHRKGASAARGAGELLALHLLHLHLLLLLLFLGGSQL